VSCSSVARACSTESKVSRPSSESPLPQTIVTIFASSYRVLDRTQTENTMAVAISMTQAAAPQLHLIKTTPAIVTGAMAAAATRARCALVIVHLRASSRSIGL
jgi:hypothetical protein